MLDWRRACRWVWVSAGAGVLAAALGYAIASLLRRRKQWAVHDETPAPASSPPPAPRASPTVRATPLGRGGTLRRQGPFHVEIPKGGEAPWKVQDGGPRRLRRRRHRHEAGIATPVARLMGRADPRRARARTREQRREIMGRYEVQGDRQLPADTTPKGRPAALYANTAAAGERQSPAGAVADVLHRLSTRRGSRHGKVTAAGDVTVLHNGCWGRTTPS